MSRTLDDLLALGLVSAVRVDLGLRRMSQRRVFIYKDLIPWIESLSDESIAGRLLSEKAELHSFFAEFISGNPLTGTIQDVSPPAGEGIRKLKAGAFRLWGWAPAEQTLVLVWAARKTDLLDRVIREGEQGKIALSIRKSIGPCAALTGPWNEVFRPQN